MPQAPLLVPQLTGGESPELAELRTACRVALTRIAAPGRQLVVVGSGPEDRRYEAAARGSLAGYGVPVEVSLGSDQPGPLELPLSLTVGAWVVRDALGPETGAIGYSVATDRPNLWQRPDTALVVVADGSARRAETAPGYLDERSGEFDAWIAEALRRGQGNMLHPPGGEVDDDLALARQLMAAGGATWDAIAATTEAADWDAELLYDAAPFGVGYFVAVWTQRA